MYSSNHLRTALISGAALVALAMTFSLRPVEAQDIPTWVNYQGRLTAPAGTPVADGSYQVTFRVFDVNAGGVELWSEVQDVTTRSGVFTTTLGKTVVFPDNLFTKRLWLEIVVNGRVLGPRQELGSVPFAMTALSFPNGSVSTAMIANLSVTSDKLAANSVTGDKIAAGTITADKIRAGTITEGKLAPGMVVPVGSVISWWGNSAEVPQGWKLCDGTSISDSKSPLNGQTAPDLRDRFIRGASGNVRASTPSGGADQHSLTVDQMPIHNHGVSDPGHGHGVSDPGHGHNIGIAIGWGTAGENSAWARVDQNGGDPNHGWAAWAGASATGISIQGSGTGISIQNSGGGQPLTTVPRYTGLVYIMRVR